MEHLVSVLVGPYPFRWKESSRPTAAPADDPGDLLSGCSSGVCKVGSRFCPSKDSNVLDLGVHKNRGRNKVPVMHDLAHEGILTRK